MIIAGRPGKEARTANELLSQWSGLKQNKGTSLQFTIVTTYGSWKSAAATVTFSC